MNSAEVQAHVDFPDKALRQTELFCKAVLDLLEKKDWEVSILICDDEEIHRLNKTYRNIDEPTDVLSFPQEDSFPDHDRFFAGDVIVSLETAGKQAEEEDEGLGEVLRRLFIHGILHLAGFDHTNDEEYTTMHERERHILSELEGVRIL